MFKENIRLFSLITNTLAKDKEIDDRWRRFKDVADSRHLANRVEARGGRRAGLGRARRLSAALAPLLQHEGQVARHGRGSPTGTATRRCPRSRERIVSWPEAREIVLDGLRRLRAGDGGDRRAVLRQRLDRRAGAAGQGAGRLLRIRRCRRRIPMCC